MTFSYCRGLINVWLITFKVDFSMRRKMHQGTCSSNLTIHGSKIESPKLWMAVGIKVLSLLSVKHQQSCWKTTWKLPSGVGPRPGPLSWPVVCLTKQTQHRDLVFCPLWTACWEESGVQGSQLWTLGNTRRRFCWQCTHSGISGACDGFTSTQVSWHFTS